MAVIIKYTAEYSMGNAVSNVNDEKIQNKIAITIGINQKKRISLPEAIPMKIESIGLTTKNKAIATSIPASAFTVFTAIKGIISITIIIDMSISIVFFNLFIIITLYIVTF